MQFAECHKMQWLRCYKKIIPTLAEQNIYIFGDATKIFILIKNAKKNSIQYFLFGLLVGNQ